MLFCFNLKL